MTPMSKSFFGAGSVILTIGGTLLALKGELPSTSLFGFGLGSYGIGICLLGFAFLIAGIITLTEPAFQLLSNSWQSRSTNWVYTKVRVSVDELPGLYADFKRIFGNDIATLESMKLWLARNEDIVWRITGKRGDEPDNVVGFFELIPLTKPAVRQLNAGRLDARRMTFRHVASRGNRSTAYYIGSVGALMNNRQYKFATMYTLIEHLREIAARSAVCLFARPVTPDGLRLIKAYSFQKVSSRMLDSESVWKLDLPQNPDLDKLDRVYRNVLRNRTGNA